MEVSIALVAFCLLLRNPFAMAKSDYYMDSSLDCGYIGVQDIGRGQSVTVRAKTKDASTSTQTGCTISFQTADNDATLRVDFESFIVNACDVKLYLSGDKSGEMNTYSCGDNPSVYTTNQRSVTLTLHRTSVNTNDYGFQLKITAVRDGQYSLPTSSDSNIMTKSVYERYPLPTSSNSNIMTTKSVYYMDSSLDCGYIGVQFIGRGQSITVRAKTKDASTSTQTGCTINFQTADNDATIRVDFESFIVNDCDVKLYLSGDAGGEMNRYSCGDNPYVYTTYQRSLTLTLHRTSVNTNDYGFQLKITAVRDEHYPLPITSDSNIMAQTVYERYPLPTSSDKNIMTKSVYYMDSSLDCGYIGVQDIGRGQSVTVRAKTKDASTSTQTGCTITFQTADNDATIRVDFESFIVNACDVKLYLSGGSHGEMTIYSCGDNPSVYTTAQRSVTLTLHRTTVHTYDYGFQLKITAVRDERYSLTSVSDSDYAYVVVKKVIGFVRSMILSIFILAFTGI